MFGIGKRKKVESDNRNDRSTGAGGLGRAQQKAAKRVLGKDTGRRVFGFACSPDIHARIKMLAGELQVPIFALAEHLVQLSAAQVTKALENSEEMDLLRRHLIEIHVDARTVEKFNWYDEELAKDLNEQRLAKLEIDAEVRRIVARFVRGGMRPQDIPFYLDYGYRCYWAVSRNQPIPRPSAPWDRRREGSRQPGNRPEADDGGQSPETTEP